MSTVLSSLLVIHTEIYTAFNIPFLWPQYWCNGIGRDREHGGEKVGESAGEGGIGRGREGLGGREGKGGKGRDSDG